MKKDEINKQKAIDLTLDNLSLIQEFIEDMKSDVNINNKNIFLTLEIVCEFIFAFSAFQDKVKFSYKLDIPKELN